MGTPVSKVYDAFLAKMLDDEFFIQEDPEDTTEAELPYYERTGPKEDLAQLLAGACAYFKFPRVSIDIDGDNFVGDLGNEEIQILSTYMKCEWLNREILTWERIKPLYEERDFSEANMLSKLYDALEIERKRGLKLESLYYRSIHYVPWDYTKLSGDPS